MAPVGAVFALMTKVGVYALLRVGTLMSEDEAAASMLGVMMFYFGIATLVAGTIGMLAAHHSARLVSYSVIVSTGILLAALGLGIEALTTPVLFYLIISSLTTGTFFMLSGMTERTRSFPPRDAGRGSRAAVAVLSGVRRACAGSIQHRRRCGRGDSARDRILGLVFVSCVLLVTGLPPLPGFVAKFALLSTAIDTAPAGVSAAPRGRSRPRCC